MNAALSQTALRELRDHMANPVRIFALLGVGLILTLLAPFDSDEMLRALPRFLYWTLLSVTGYTIGYLGNMLADRQAADKGPWLRTLIATPPTAIGVFIAVLGLNYGFLGYVPSGQTALFIAGNVLAISAVVSAIMQYAYHQLPQADGPPNRDDLLDRLPYEKRGPLVSISSEDHYIRIVTTKGEDLVLMRLSDALREIGATPGLQVHRSHWVALDQIEAVEKQKDRATLTMRHGQAIPVSRSYLPALRDINIL